MADESNNILISGISPSSFVGGQSSSTPNCPCKFRPESPPRDFIRIPKHRTGSSVPKPPKGKNQKKKQKAPVFDWEATRQEVLTGTAPLKNELDNCYKTSAKISVKIFLCLENHS